MNEEIRKQLETPPTTAPKEPYPPVFTFEDHIRAHAELHNCLACWDYLKGLRNHVTGISSVDLNGVTITIEEHLSEPNE